MTAKGNAMTPVITSKQAKQVTGGRAPFEIAEYETAINALAACVTLDEAKYWDNKADAIAAWAKIYHDETAARRAKQLKLHAYRRMGQLAQELRPTRLGSLPGVCGGGNPRGAPSLLMEQGLRRSQALIAVRFAKTDAARFKEFIEAPRPPSFSTAYKSLVGKGSDAWQSFAGTGQGVSHFRAFIRSHSAGKLAAELAPDEAEKARALVTELQEWLDEFEQHLPKAKP
jgi:hypothetical protein